MSPNEASAGNEFSSAIGKHSSDSSRGVKVVRHVHRVAPFDIFPRAPFSRITIGTRGGGGGGWILTDRSEKLLSLYIYIYILPRDVNEETRSSVLERIPLEGRKRGGKRGAPDGRVAPRRSTEIELSGRRVTDESLRGGMSRNVETSRLYSPFTSSKKL